VTRNNYGVLLREEGRFREAAEQLELAGAAAAAAGDEAPAPLANLGDLYRREGFDAKAEPLLTRAIDAARTGRESAIGLQRLARSDYDRRQYAAAVPLLEQALVLTGRVNDDETRASILEDLGNVRREMRQFAEATKAYTEALVVRERAGGETPMFGELLENIAMLAMRQNRLADAEPPLLRARRIYERMLPAENAYTATLLGRLAALYRDQKRFTEAEPLFTRSIELQEKTMTPGAPIVAVTLGEYAQLLRAQNRSIEAAAVEERAKRLRESQRPGVF